MRQVVASANSRLVPTSGCSFSRPSVIMSTMTPDRDQEVEAVARLAVTAHPHEHLSLSIQGATAACKANEASEARIGPVCDAAER